MARASSVATPPIRQGSRKGLRTLAREDDLGIELVHLLDEQQQKVANYVVRW